jgi:hypothetical protein
MYLALSESSLKVEACLSNENLDLDFGSLYCIYVSISSLSREGPFLDLVSSAYPQALDLLGHFVDPSLAGRVCDDSRHNTSNQRKLRPQ